MELIKTLRRYKTLFRSEHKEPVKDLNYLAIYYPFNYDTVCAVSKRLEDNINETEKCLLFSQWLNFDPVWMAERTKSECVDVVVQFYNSVDITEIERHSRYLVPHNYSDILVFVEFMRAHNEQQIKQMGP